VGGRLVSSDQLPLLIHLYVFKSGQWSTDHCWALRAAEVRRTQRVWTPAEARQSRDNKVKVKPTRHKEVAGGLFTLFLLIHILDVG